MIKSTKQCAYCNDTGSLTKEHIWPRSIIKKYEPKLKTYNKRINKFIDGDPMIKDVCANCNGRILSQLDAYLSALYDRHLYKCLSPGDSTIIEYDYAMLLRSLLKISYNCARAAANKKNIKAHKKLARYILNGKHVSSVQLRLVVVTSANAVVDGKIIKDAFPVTQLRCADISYNGRLSRRFLIRLIAINSFWFYIKISHNRETKRKWGEFLDGFSAWKLQSGLLVEPNSHSLHIQADQTT